MNEKLKQENGKLYQIAVEVFGLDSKNRLKKPREGVDIQIAMEKAYEQGKRDGVEKILHRLKILWRSCETNHDHSRQTFTLPRDWETYLRNIGADK